MTSASTGPVAPTAVQRSLILARLLDCLALLALAFALRFAFLANEPLWTDEVFTVYWSQLDPNFLIGQGTHIETNLPAYFLLMHAWI